PNNKTTQGLWYHSFGMDDTRNEGGVRKRFRRWFVGPGACWDLGLVARRTTYPAGGDRAAARPLAAAPALGQAPAALGRLCHFGGAGSKARKGFGSFAEPEGLRGLDLDRCREAAAAFREACGLGRRPFDPRLAESASLEQL